MTSRDLSRLMWSEALSLLDQADRLHRQFCRPVAARLPAWEPPVDMIETADELRVHVALPGATPDSIMVGLEPGVLTVTAQRPFAATAARGAGAARIHALEIPYGRFERRIGLPARPLTLAGKSLENGCLTLIFHKEETA